MWTDPRGLRIWILLDSKTHPIQNVSYSRISILSLSGTHYLNTNLRLYISAQQIPFVQNIGSYNCYQECHLMEQLLQTFTHWREL
jgi:hypothetical protein